MELINNRAAAGIQFRKAGIIPFIQECTHISVGCTHISVGCIHISVGCTHIAVGCTHIAVGCTHIAVGCIHIAVGCTHIAVGCTLSLKNKILFLNGNGILLKDGIFSKNSTTYTINS